MKYVISAVLAGLVACCAPSPPAERIAANPAKYENLSARQQELVREGRIDTGMPPDAVLLAWGSPSRRYDGGDGGTRTSRWDYAGSRPVYTTGWYGGYRYGGYGRYGRYAWSVAPEVTFIPYRRASVWFRNDRVSKWERVR